ncbi:MFS transporter [Jeotgalibacillus soli]|uniref:MFS transporter n=2 Tax=Jeotgalibacillus soli TaxID=889306 RepID=A0A0C2VV12_9BACL|nr:MFS transporter [Jeotgalibacillus soli]
MTVKGLLLDFYLLSYAMVPFLFLAPIGWKLADRFQKKKLIITIDLLRIPFVLSLLFVQGPEQL